MSIWLPYNKMQWESFKATNDALTGNGSTWTECRWPDQSSGAMPVPTATSAAYPILRMIKPSGQKLVLYSVAT